MLTWRTQDADAPRRRRQPKGLGGPARMPGASAGRALSRLVRTRRDRWILGTGAVFVVAALVVSGVLVYQSLHPAKQITALFPETIGVYPQSTVRVLGVPVGTVDAVKPDGTSVKVIMTIDSGVKIPARVDAVVLAPSVVSDRYIQLTPAYTGGPLLASGAVIPASRTAVPVEVDQVYASLAKLATALGPHGANKHDALSDLIKTGTKNLAGNGTYLRQMLTEFGGLSKTLGGSAGNLFASVAYLQQFTTMLKQNNGQVKQAEQQLAEVSAFLASDRQELSAALSQLATALGQIKTFVGSNRSLLAANVNKLASITSLLVAERASLAEALDDAPLAADNVVNAYNTTTHTLDGRGDLLEFEQGRGSLLTSASPPGSVAVPPAELSLLPPLPLPSAGSVYGTPAALTGGKQ
ncbi:MAG TPA: MCE family protein [Streptosporangiaceae bacterium]|nr:MCE family protein [Streptosporangiaceae bacterium]